MWGGTGTTTQQRLSRPRFTPVRELLRACLPAAVLIHLIRLVFADLLNNVDLLVELRREVPGQLLLLRLLPLLQPQPGTTVSVGPELILFAPEILIS